MCAIDDSNLAEWSGWRRQLHRNPELAFEETETSQFVAAKLREFGLEVTTGIAKTGVIGSLRSDRSERGAIGLRADLDALPIAELNEFPHRSARHRVMHACGHDGHTAMLLGAAQTLAEQCRSGSTLPGAVHFIFQPAEEGAGGALEMIRQGLLERFAMDAVFGMHNWPGLPIGNFAIRQGPMMAASDSFEIAIQGRGCHAAMPHLGVDPISIGSQIVNALQTIVSRKLPPDVSAVVSVTQFHAGDALGVIPDSALLRGTSRSFDRSTSELVERELEKISQNIAQASGASASVIYQRRYPPTINTANEADFCRRVAQRLAGPANVHGDLPPSMGAEDFAFLLERVPGAYIWLGNGPTAGNCLLHSPHYDFNDQAMRHGVGYWVRLVNDWFSANPPDRRDAFGFLPPS